MSDFRQAGPNQWVLDRGEEGDDCYTVCSEPKVAEDELGICWHGVSVDISTIPTELSMVAEISHPLRHEVTDAMNACTERALAVAGDELREAWDAAEENLDESRRHLRRLEVHQELGRMTDDEVSVVHAFVLQLMGEGREEYGPLDLSTDTRTFEELLGEMIDEGNDRIFYTIVAKMVRTRRHRQQETEQ